MKLSDAQKATSDAQKATVEKARKAVRFADNGDPIKDAIDDDEMLDALRLLAQVVADGEAHVPASPQWCPSCGQPHGVQTPESAIVKEHATSAGGEKHG